MAFLLMAAATLMAAQVTFTMSVFAAKAIVRTFRLRPTRLGATQLVAVVVVSKHRISTTVQGCAWGPFPAAPDLMGVSLMELGYGFLLIAQVVVAGGLCLARLVKARGWWLQGLSPLELHSRAEGWVGWWERG